MAEKVIGWEPVGAGRLSASRTAVSGQEGVIRTTS
jgi:predicted dinucleotide-binding enzyme